MRTYKFIIALCLALACAANAVARPRVVVQIVVGGLGADFADRFGHNFGQSGFRRFMGHGVVMTDSRYDFMQTTTPATLATITTGADPATHGITGGRWVDNTTGRQVQLIADPDAAGLDADYGVAQHSPLNLIAPTLGDRLMAEDPDSRVVTIAMDPLSAVVMGGFTGQVYWLDTSRFAWTSSNKYMSRLPSWVADYNRGRPANRHLDYDWFPLRDGSRYRNRAYTVINAHGMNAVRSAGGFDPVRDVAHAYGRILYTPAADVLLAEFVRLAIAGNELGRDEHCDLLNICFDSPRYVAERYGRSSIEFEDMVYRLDTHIAGIVDFVLQHTPQNDAVFVLTGDHGMCDVNPATGRQPERFNTAMFRLLLNSHLSSLYGAGDWVLDYVDRQVYLDRRLVQSLGLDPAQVQQRAAMFALQFEGVSGAYTATALQNGAAVGDAARVGRSFYAKRGGDVVINLMPGWIEDTPAAVSGSGSLYGYDTHVPLMVLGGGLKPSRLSRPVDMKDLAPTLARIMGIDYPVAATGKPIEEIAYQY